MMRPRRRTQNIKRLAYRGGSASKDLWRRFPSAALQAALAPCSCSMPSSRFIVSQPSTFLHQPVTKIPLPRTNKPLSQSWPVLAIFSAASARRRLVASNLARLRLGFKESLEKFMCLSGPQAQYLSTLSALCEDRGPSKQPLHSVNSQ